MDNRTEQEKSIDRSQNIFFGVMWVFLGFMATFVTGAILSTAICSFLSIPAKIAFIVVFIALIAVPSHILRLYTDLARVCWGSRRARRRVYEKLHRKDPPEVREAIFRRQEELGNI